MNTLLLNKQYKNDRLPLSKPTDAQCLPVAQWSRILRVWPGLANSRVEIIVLCLHAYLVDLFPDGTICTAFHFRVDTDNDDFVDQNELEEWIKQKIQEHFDEATEENQKVFSILDTDRNG